ncbi:hypothetical protein ACFSRY_14625 [Pontibacter locisalis]|uniref:Vitamin K-dependent gamma-carboxylase n=1 Tax=Pontibacter locisalis TaxID=1719035 RepID=A0ABW5IQS2_9BACT
MTPSLLSAFKETNIRTKSDQREDISRNVFNFFVSVQVFRIFTFVWIYWTIQKFILLQDRPKEIFWFNDKLVSWIMPALPGETLFYTIAGIAIAANLVQLVFLRNMVIVQLVLALCLLWLNLPHWGYGFLSHVNHTLLLSHLFLIFVPVSRHLLQAPDKYVHQAINWFYAGILFTYTLAGLWKVPSLLFKLVTFSPDAHWLHPYGALFNSFVSYRNFDLNFELETIFTEHVLLWQVSFLIVVYLQSISIFGAFRQPLRPWIGLLLIIFHVMNMLVFLTYFVVATLLIVCLFTPYSLILQPLYKRYYAVINSISEASVVKEPAEYQTAFENYRNKIKESNYYLSGILFLPGLRTASRLLHYLRHKR